MLSFQLLLHEATKDTSYKNDVNAFVQQYLPSGTVTHTPCGLAWRDQWGSLRYAGTLSVNITYEGSILKHVYGPRKCLRATNWILGSRDRYTYTIQAGMERPVGSLRYKGDLFSFFIYLPILDGLLIPVILKMLVWFASLINSEYQIVHQS